MTSTGSFWVESRYTKPTTVHQVHPDLSFRPSELAGTPFIKSSQVGAKRKRDDGTAGDPHYWANADVLKCRNFFNEWRRSEACNIPEQGDLEIFVVDAVEGFAAKEQLPRTLARKLEHPLDQPMPVISVVGNCLEDGSSICLRIWGFFPYVMVECAKGLETQMPTACEKLKQYVESNLSGGKELRHKVVSVDSVEGESLMDYRPDRPKHFFRINLTSPRLVSSCRTLVEAGIKILDHNLNSTPFEASVPYVLRWMIDSHVVGCGWLRIGCVNTFPVDDTHRTTRCQREVDIYYNDVSAIPAVGKYQLVPEHLRVLALDIECVTVASAGFPVADKDPVIQISSILSTPGRTTPMVKMIFTLDTCAPVAGAVVISFKDEKAMLSTWREMVVTLDPDILTGYNFINFDLNYLVSRSMKLDIPNFRNLGRVITLETKIRDSVLSTKALGTHENKDINIEGRIQFDALELIRRDYKLKSYSLNGVSAHFLKEQKEDVHYSQIGNLQRGNAETRKRIAVYCIKDSWLVIRLLESLSFLVNYIEMARVTGVSINMLLTRGQQIKVTSQLMRKCRELHFFMPSLRVQGGGGEVAYEGATVLDPMKDFYDVPIATLDFASLYPSIMIAHNLCYSTLVQDMAPDALGLKTDDYFKTPAGKIFVKSHVKKGILPTVVADLLAARKVAKRS